MLKGKNIFLRAVEPTDIETLYLWENDTSIWKVSNTITPFSFYQIEQYVISEQDIFAQKQLRLMICLTKNAIPIGSIDLFDFDPLHARAGVGIHIANTENKGKGYASETLSLLIEYCFTVLQLHQLFCNISCDNEISLKFFKKHGFCLTGTKKDWIKENNSWKDMYFLQLLNEKR